MHLDYYLTGQDDEIKNESGTLFEDIDLWNDYKKGNSKEEIKVHDEQKDSITIQVMVFPQNSLFSYTEDGKSGRDLVEQSLQLDANCVVGVPHNEWCAEDGNHSIKEIVHLAVKYDKLIDVHCDGTDDDQVCFLEILNAESMKQCYGESTTASHTSSFGSANDA